MLSPLTGSLTPLGVKRGGGTPVLTETANLLTWLEADAGTFQSSGGSAATADGDPVGQWQDQSGNGEHATQADSALKPTLRLAGNGIGGRAALAYDGSADTLSISLSSTSGAYSVYFVIDPDTQSAISYLYDVQTGRLVLANRTADTTNVGWFDGAFHNIAASTTTAQVLSFHLGGGTGEVYRGSTLLGSDTYTAKNIGDAQRIGSAFDGGGGHYKGLFAMFLPYSVKHDSTQRASVLSYINAKYGV